MPRMSDQDLQGVFCPSRKTSVIRDQSSRWELQADFQTKTKENTCFILTKEGQERARMCQEPKKN